MIKVLLRPVKNMYAMIKLLLLILPLLVLASCTATKPWYSKNGTQHDQQPAEQKQPDYRLILMGDQGEPKRSGEDQVLNLLTLKTKNMQQGDIVFLGDNIYRYGMETEPPEAKVLAENKISKTLSAIRGFDGNVFFIAGNHDWWLGHENLVAQQAFLEAYPHLEKIHFSPKAGCPGPEVVELNEQMLLVLMDSEWYFQNNNENIAQSLNCPHSSWQSAMDELRTIAETNIDKFLILAIHHPLHSQGKHGGHFTLKHHLFPLTEKNANLWFPLPVVGSLYPLLRKAGISKQDFSSSANRDYRDAVYEAVACHPNVVIASGHDHNLQYFHQDGLHQVVSGSGSKITPVKKGGKAEFVSPTKGFVTIDVYDQKEFILSYWHIEDTINPVFTKRLDDPEKLLPASVLRSEGLSFPDSIVVITDSIYDIGKTGRFFWGEHHRKGWTLPHRYKVLSLREAHGGLNIYRVGGGFQTTTLFVKDPNDRRYVLRSIRKDPVDVLPEMLQETFAKEIVQDQISASHPFGAAIVGPIAAAAGIYYNTPEYYYLPDDPALGQYRKRARNQPVVMEEFISKLYLKEKFNDDVAEVINTEILMERLYDAPKHQVDLEWYWRTKLVDMLLGDWDRHEGQYFWVAIEQENGLIYRPFPIDRDNVMFMMDGVIPSMMNKKWNMPQLQHFDYDIEIIEGINFQSMHMDRRIMAGLVRDDWIRIATELQGKITDSVIMQAVANLPQIEESAVYQTMVNKFKSRRDKLDEFAERYYDVFSRELEMATSTGDDLITIDLAGNGKAVIKISSANDNEKTYVERTIHDGETKEVRIYLIDGSNALIYNSHRHKLQTKFRIIPGNGNLTIQHDGAGKVPSNIFVQSKPFVPVSAAVRKHNMDDFTKTAIEQYDYNYMEYALGITAPAFSLGYSSDDGVYLGGGVIWKKPGFRKYPFAAVHKIVANVAPQNGSFNLFYEGDFTRVFGNLDLLVNANVYAPNNSSKYFGIGNDTPKYASSRFYNVRRDLYEINVWLKKPLNNNSTLLLGPGFAYTDVREKENKFYTTAEAGLKPEDFDHFSLPGFVIKYLYNSTNSLINPTKGIKARIVLKYEHNLTTKQSLLRGNASISVYQKIPGTGIVVASRIGGLHNFGTFKFFQANVLGGAGILYSPDKDLFDRANFRGDTRDRYSGRTVVYHNTDLRWKIRDVKSSVLPGQLGLQMFFDHGKVWADHQISNTWHYGYGGGLWYNFFGSLVVNASYGHSKQGRSFTVLTGFLF